MSAEFENLTREDVLDGLFDRSARAASATLFVIESRTAHLVAQSKQAMERFLTEEVAQERELVFLEALALGHEPPLRPTIQDLEHYASQWASLVPDNPRLQATLAHLLGQKYTFTYQAIPAIRAALNLDTEAVKHIYQRMYSEPLEKIFAARSNLSERLRWSGEQLAAWVETLPPFWIVFSLTLTETVGAGILALPIALANVGPLGGVSILVLFGLVNMLTIAYMAEAVARNGRIRYGNAFLGQLVTDYLGRAGSFTLSLGLITMCFLTLWPYYIGFSTTLANATHIPAPLWCALLFFIGLYILRRETLNATIVSALVIGAINIGLILILSLLTFLSLGSSHILHINLPLIGGNSFDPSILQLIFGVILLAYFGHMSVSNCAQTVLHRDPNARSLIWGSVAAQAVVMLIYCVWVVAVNGAIGPQTLANLSGTALVPLAAEIGPIIHILGSVFVILGMGIGTLHSSLPLYNLVRERLPTRRALVMILPRRQGRLLLRKDRRELTTVAGDLQLALTYLGLESAGDMQERQSRFFFDAQVDGIGHHLDLPVEAYWEVTSLFDQVPGLRRSGVHMALDILEATQEYVRLRIDSPLHLAYEGEWYFPGQSMADVFALPDLQQQLVTWFLREETNGRDKKSLHEVAAQIGQSEARARKIMSALVGQGFIREVKVDDKTHYSLRLVSRRGRQIPKNIWQALDEEKRVKGGPETGILHLVKRTLSGKLSRYLISVSPVAAVFLLAEWLLLTRKESFTEPLSFLGVIVISLLGGIFPVLLLIASRRKGEIVPGVEYRFLGNPILTTGIYLLYLAGLFLHGLVIWENLAERFVAILVGGIMLGLTIVLARKGLFTPRVVIELRADQRKPGQAVFAVAVGGQQAISDVRLGYPDGEKRVHAATGAISNFSTLQYAAFHLPVTEAREIKIWAHQVTPEGNSESLSGVLYIQLGNEKKEFDLKSSAGQVIMPIDGSACQVMIARQKSG